MAPGRSLDIYDTGDEGYDQTLVGFPLLRAQFPLSQSLMLRLVVLPRELGGGSPSQLEARVF